jgi:hypothetical protein
VAIVGLIGEDRRPGESFSEFLANQEKKNYDANQRRNQSTDNQRHHPIPTIDRLRPSAFLRRPYA